MLSAARLCVYGADSPAVDQTAEQLKSTEQTWIIKSILDDIGRMALLSQKQDLAAWTVEVATVQQQRDDKFRISLNWPKSSPIGEAPLQLVGAIWNPANYAPIATKLLAAGPSAPGNSPVIEGDPLQRLTTPTTESIQAENLRVSSWLTGHPLDPNGHEQAALLLALLGFREHAGIFSDVRGFCNRATAHLAMAAALRGGGNSPSDCGIIADAMIEALIGNEVASEKLLAGAETRARASAELRPWINAIRMRNTADYRIALEPGKDTLLEKLELFLALNQSSTVENASKLRTDAKLDGVVDCSRIAFEFNMDPEVISPSAFGAIVAELRDAAGIFPELRDAAKIFPDLSSELKADAIDKALNREPGFAIETSADGKPVFRVIDDSAWAMTFQRHLGYVIYKVPRILNASQARMGDIVALLAREQECFSGLAFYPVAKTAYSNESQISAPETAPLFQALVKLAKVHPEWIPDASWLIVASTLDAAQKERVRSSEDASLMAKLSTWKTTMLPIGTTLGFTNYAKTFQILPIPMEPLFALAPRNFEIVRRYHLSRMRGDDDFKKIMGPLLEYSLPAQKEYAQHSQPVRSADFPSLVSEHHDTLPKAALQLTEQTWIVKAIVEDLARMAAFTGEQDAKAWDAKAIAVEQNDEDKFQLSIKVPERSPLGDLPLKLAGSIWEPTNYAPLAAKFLAAIPLAPGKAPSIEGNLLQRLATPLAEAIQEENIRVSKWLTIHPLDPAAHEQAALLLSLAAFREHAGPFSDIRGFCNRATAHLAMAGALRQGRDASDCGKVSLALIHALVGNEVESEKQIAALETRSAEAADLRPWITAIRLRNTADYRLVPDPAKATLLERLELFHAQCESLTPEAAVKALANSKVEEIADWPRLLLESRFNVGEGNAMTSAALRLELTEAAKIFPELSGDNPKRAAINAALNRDPGFAITVGIDGAPAWRVIDDGAWAHAIQRHLCNEIYRTYMFLERQIADHPEAEAYDQSVRAAFGELLFFPFTKAISTTVSQVSDPEFTPFYKALAKLARAHPEWIPDPVWLGVMVGLPHGPDRRILLPPNEIPVGGSEWMQPPIPFGTTYGFATRKRSEPISPAQVERLRALAPSNYDLAQHSFEDSENRSSPETYRKFMSRLLDYSLPAQQHYARLLQIANSPDYVPFIQKLAKKEPYLYLEIAQFFVTHHMDAEAAEAYQSAIDQRADPVGVSNQCDWLVNYYYERGEQEKAMAVAKFAADVYSSAGLQTMARLLERNDDLAGAEEYYLKIVERYQSVSPVAEFYKRHIVPDADSVYARKLREFIEKFFPGGLKHVELSQFKDAPQKGVIIMNENDLLEKAGMKADDIIVALDGFRTEDFPQYTFARALTKSPQMAFIVYRDGKYFTVDFNLPGRQFNLDFRSYVAPNPQKAGE